MRLTAPTSTAHIGQVEIRGVQRVMEFEATENHHRRRQQQQQHRHAARRGQQPSQAVTPAELDAVQSRTVIVVPCKDEPLDRILSVWAGIPPGSLIMAVSGSAEGAYRAEREALAGFCRDTGRSGMCVWQRDPVLAGALRQVGLTALLDGDDDGDGNWDGDGDAGLVHKGKGEALVIGIALAAVARGPDGRGLPSRRSNSRSSSSNNSSSCCSHRECQGRHRFGGERNARVGGQDIKARYDDGGSQQDNTTTTTTTNTRRGNGREHAGSSLCRGRSRGACQQRDGGNRRGGGIEEEEEEEEREGGEGGDDDDEEEEEREDGPNGTRTGFYKYIGFVDADNFVPGSVHEYCKAFSSGLHLASAEDAMVRISWGSKPKVKDGNIEFKKSGRSSEVVNRWFNRLLEEMRGGCAMAGDAAQPLSHICTGNAGEHAMTLSLALKLRLASGYAIEPFHFLDIFERFAGGWGDDDDNNDNNKAAAAAAAASSPPRPASLPELGSSPISSMSSSPLPTPMDCSPVLSASSPSGAPAALEGISALPPLPPPSATVVEATVAAMRAMYSSAAASSSPSPSSPSSSPRPSGPAGGGGGGGKVQILQVRTMNPHFHDTSKGESHIAKMWMQGLSAIYHSPVTARLPAYRDALWAAILEGKAKLEGGGANSSTAAKCAAAAAAAAGDWEPERCRIYPAPAGFDLLRLRDILETSEGSYWWSGMDEDDEDVFDEEEEEDVEDEVHDVDEVPLEDTPNVDFGLDGCPYGMSYRTREAIMEFLHDSSSPSGELQLQLPPADAVQNGAFQGRQDFPLPQRDFGLERAVRSKTPKEQQQGGTNLWYPWFCP